MPDIENSLIDNYKVTTITSGRLEQNCFLVKHLPSNDLLLIDPGAAIQDIITAIDKEGAQLKLILLTHGHYDHVEGVKPIAEKYNLPFWIQQNDVKLFKRAPIYTISMEKRVIEISLDYKLFEETVSGWEGDRIDVIHTPGHTPGSVCFYFGKMVFTGDVILSEQATKLELPGFNDAELTASISRILNDLPGDTIIFPGHGKAVSVNDKKTGEKIHTRL